LLCRPSQDQKATEPAVREARREQRNWFEANVSQPRARGDARCQANSAIGAALLGHGMWKGQSA
jgi:hypothetical protein